MYERGRLDVFEASPRGFVLPIGPPREEQEDSAEDGDGRTKADLDPDSIEDHDPEHADQQEPDCGCDVLGPHCDSHRVRVYEQSG